MVTTAMGRDTGGAERNAVPSRIGPAVRSRALVADGSSVAGCWISGASEGAGGAAAGRSAVTGLRPGRRPMRPARSSGGRRWLLVPPRGGGSAVVRQYTGGSPADALLARRHATRAHVPRAEPVRLTARGRLVLCVALLALILAAFSIGRVSRAASAGPSRGALGTVVVQPGQTLWEVAGHVAPGADRRATVARIMRLNPGRAIGHVQPGQVLWVPVSRR
jgi:LysM domain